MEYTHSQKQDLNLGTAFITGIIINVIFIVIETFFGFFSHSMALVSDAGHNLSDVLALGFSWIAVLLSQRKPTLKFTYGFRRSTILVALLNTIFLLLAVVFIGNETIYRLSHPAEIEANVVMVVAVAAIGVNAATAWLFFKGKNHDLNIRSAFIHFVADALVSFGVVIAGLLIALTGIQWIDSLVSFAIIGVILYSAYNLLIDSVNLALDAVPENINIEEVREYLENLEEVKSVHDLHIWALSTTDAALTVHLITSEHTNVDFINTVQQRLHDTFSIGHSTIQIEYGIMAERDNKI